jgi:hypothetical protein
LDKVKLEESDEKEEESKMLPDTTQVESNVDAVQLTPSKNDV